MTTKKKSPIQFASKTARSVSKDVEQGKRSVKSAAKAVKQISKAITKIVTRKTKGDNSSKKSATKKPTSNKTTQQKSASPSYPKKLSSKRSYSLRDLPIAEQSTIKNYMLEIERHPELDQLRMPGEFWSFKLNGGRSTQAFETIELAAAALSRYQLRHTVNEDVEAVQFLKFHGKGVNTSKPLTEKQESKLLTSYKTTRKREAEKRKMEDSKVFQAAEKLVEKKTGVKAHRSVDIIRGFMTANTELEKSIKAMQKQMQAMQKQMEQLTKPSKTAKKAATKKQVSKKQATKKQASKKVATKKQVTKKGGTTNGTPKPAKKGKVTKGTQRKASNTKASGKKATSSKGSTRKAKQTKGKKGSKRK